MAFYILYIPFYIHYVKCYVKYVKYYVKYYKITQNTVSADSEDRNRCPIN